MNAIYRKLWNRRLGQWVVASELSRARGRKQARARRRALAGGLLLALGMASGAAWGSTDCPNNPSNDHQGKEAGSAPLTVPSRHQVAYVSPAASRPVSMQTSGQKLDVNSSATMLAMAGIGGGSTVATHEAALAGCHSPAPAHEAGGTSPEPAMAVTPKRYMAVEHEPARTLSVTTTFSSASMLRDALAPMAASPMALAPSDPRRPPPPETPPPGLVMGTGSVIGTAGTAINPVTSALLDPNDPYFTSGALKLAKANVTTAYSGGVTVIVLGLPVTVPVKVMNTFSAVDGTVVGTGTNQHLTLLGGVASDSYITNINNGATNNGIINSSSPAWANNCVNINVDGMSGVNVPCWGVNAAQNNQVVIGDQAYANGSEEVVIGTSASHKLADVDANTAFPGDGNRNSTTDPMGLPSDDYQSRLGHSVVIGDSATGTQTRQTIIGANATSDKANSVALGYGSNADRGALPADYINAYGLQGKPQTSVGEVAVGNIGHARQITHVAAGTDDHDAVNVLQLHATAQNVTTALGGGAVLGTSGVLSAPTYHIRSNDYHSVGAALGAVDTALGQALAGSVKYFHANSTDADAVANDNNSVAIGPNAVATGDSSLAVGNGAAPNGTDAVAVGAYASTDGDNSFAAGSHSHAAEGGVAIGWLGSTGAAYSVAIGTNTNALGTSAVALGQAAKAEADGSIAIGHTAKVHDAQTVHAANGIAIGNAATISAGYEDAPDAIAIGSGAQVHVSGSTAMGKGAIAGDTDPSESYGDSSDTAIGSAAYAHGSQSSALGYASEAAGPDSIALGANSAADKDSSVAIGHQAHASAANAVALGSGSLADVAGTVSVGTSSAQRRIVNVAEGTGDHDAVNVKQLDTAIAGVATPAGMVAYDGSSHNSITLDGGSGSTAIHKLADGVSDSDAVNKGQLDDAMRYFKANSSVTDTAPVAGGNHAVAIGRGAVAQGSGAFAAGDGASTGVAGGGANYGVAIGHSASAAGDQATSVGAGSSAAGTGALAMAGATAAASGSITLGNLAGVKDDGTGHTSDNGIAIGTLAKSWGDDSVAMGSQAAAGAKNVTGTQDVAIGYKAVAWGGFSIALGSSSLASKASSVAIGKDSWANAANAVALGAGSYTDAANTVSVGSTTSQRRIVNVAKGTGDHDAVNVKQMQDYVANNGGGGGSGSPLAVSYDGAGKTSVTLAGTGGTTITGVKAGALSATSTDAVNGSQLYATNQDVTANAADITTNTGDIAGNTGAIQTNTTAITANGTAIGTNTGDITTHTQELADHEQRLTDNRTDIDTNTTAIGTLNSTAVFYANAGHAQVQFGQAGTPVTLSNVAQGTANTDAVNVKQLSDAVANGVGQGTQLVVQYDGTSKDSITLAGANNTMITHVKAGNVSAASTDAINGSQLHATNQDVSTNTAGITTNQSDIAGNTGNIQTNTTAIAANGVAIGTHTGDIAAHTQKLADHDQRLTDNRKDIDTNTTAIGTLNSMAVFYANAAHTQVMFGTAGTPVTLSNVAAGMAPTDAVNKAQLDAVAAQAGQTAANAVTYDNAGKTSITLAGQGGTAVSGVKAGALTTSSADAVNGSQLYATNQDVSTNTTAISTNTSNIATNTTAIGNLDTRVTTVEGQVTRLQQSTATLSYMAVDGKGDGSDAASVKAGSHGVAIGSNARAGGDHGTAIGGDSYAAGPDDTALGGNATVNADGSTALGANANVATAATNAVAVGESAAVSAASGTAVGQGAQVTVANAVALGQGSVADQAGTVSVGSAGHERRVTNVATGKAATDAVNKDQLDAVTQRAVETAKKYAQSGDAKTLRQANAYTDQQIQAALGGDVAKFRQNVNDRFYQVDRRMDRMSAMRSASTQMAINAADAQGNGRVAVGVGFSSGKSALSVGYGAPLGNRLHISFGATASGLEASAGIGFGVDL